MPTDDDVAFAGVAIREGLLSEEQLESSLRLMDALRRSGSIVPLHGVLVAEKVIDLGLANRILTHRRKDDLLCPSCERKQSVLGLPLKPVFRCPACATELPHTDGMRPPQVEAIRERIRDVLLWHEADSLAGQTLGGVQLLRRIGQGRAGTVYDGILLESDQRVSIRVLPKTLGKHRTYVDAFRFEADVLSRVAHPNVVKIHRTGEERGRQFVVMESVEGRSLKQVLGERGPLPVKEALATITQAAQGLQAAHERGLVHRDIKPQNLLCTEAGIVKVADFGLAKNREEVAAVFPSGEILGSPAYLSPEQAAGRPADARSDIYSLGATFYHALVGHPPFQGDAPITVLNSHIHDKVTYPHLLREEVPRDVSQVVTRMLAKRPEDRYAGAPALLSALRRLGSAPEEPLSKLVSPGASFGFPRHRASSLQVMILILLGAGALAMAVYVLDLLKWMREQDSATLVPGLLQGDGVGEFTSQIDRAAMILIPGGTFRMGPQTSEHVVHLGEYLIDKHEVSNARYKRFLDWLEESRDHSGCAPGEPAQKSHRPTAPGGWGEAERPVVGVDWYDAYAFAAWAGKRLPTEAEWEKAARGIDGRIYPWGNTLEGGGAISAEVWAGEGIVNEGNWERLFYRKRPWREAVTGAVVGMPQGASPFGVLRMAGNVREWVQDWFEPDYWWAGEERDPTGPEAGYERTIRGGSWRDPPEDLRLMVRKSSPPTSRSLHVGFRCAKDFHRPR